jgi:hypothetical protein
VSVFPESQHQKPRQPNVTDIVSGTFRDHQSRRTRCPPSPATSRRTRRCGTKPLQTLQFEVVNLAIRPGIIGRGPAITRWRRYRNVGNFLHANALFSDVKYALNLLICRCSPRCMTVTFRTARIVAGFTGKRTCSGRSSPRRIRCLRWSV